MKRSSEPLGLSRHAAWAAVAALALLGAGLRALHLDSGLWYDEIRTLIESVRPPLAEILTTFPGNNNHPLYSVLGNLSIAAFGETAWSLRLPAVIFGVATIPMLYVFGASVSTRLEALAAAGLLAVSYHHVWFSQNARGYTLLLFCTLLATHLLLVGLRNRRHSVFAAYAVVAALGAYTHLTMVFVVLSHAIVVAWQALPAGGRRFDVRQWTGPALGFVLAGALTLLLYAPILLEVRSFFEQDAPSKQVATAGWAFWAMLRGLQVGFATGWGVVLAGLLFAAGCWSYFRQSPAACALFLLPAPIVLAAALALDHPIRPRFFFFLMGFGLLIAVRGTFVVGAWFAGRIPDSVPEAGRRLGARLPALLVVGMVVLSALALPRGYKLPKQDFERAARFVEDARQAGESIVIVGGGAAFPYQRYYMKPWPRVDTAEGLRSALAAHDAVWLLFTFPSYIERDAPDLMAVIRTGCAAAESFPGTVAGGSIEVFRCTPVAGAGLAQ